MAWIEKLEQGSTSELPQNLIDIAKVSVDPLADQIKKIITVDEKLKPDDDGFEIITLSENNFPIELDIHPKKHEIVIEQEDPKKELKNHTVKK